MNLILVGYRGSGKSTVGAILADRLGWPYVDLDDLVVRRSGRTISAVFAEEGEIGFRQREREAYLSLRGSKHQVVALGGGALTDPGVRGSVRRLGKVVWLRAPAAVLWARISQDRNTSDSRPDLTADGGLPEVEAMLLEREPVYRKVADHTVDTFPESPETVAETIAMWFQAGDATRRK